MIPLGAEEGAIVVDEVRRHGNKALADAIQDGRFQLLASEEGSLRLVPRALAEFLRSNPAPEPTTIGEPWGDMRRGVWKPSLAAVVRVGASTSSMRATLLEVAVQPFLYGRPALRRSVKQVDGSAKPGNIVWVVDPRGEILGLARVLGPGRGDELLEPVVDLGWYLREGG